MIRRAKVADVPAMAGIINDCAELGLMLPRSLEALYESVRNFYVAQDEGEIVGVCGLTIVWANLSELASLVVAPGQRKKGLGRQLAQCCIEEAKHLGVRRIMTLTYERTFFEKLGFSVVDRHTLPMKVWRECVHCPKNKACDEIAMVLELGDVPELKVDPPRRLDTDKIPVPVTWSARQRFASAPAEND